MEYNANTQMRKAHLVINNPIEKNYTREVILERLRKMPLVYFCLSDEVGEQGTYHTHIYLFSRSPIRFSTLKNMFPCAHIQRAYGSSKQNQEYIRKGGKWEDSAKADTVVDGSFYEWGELPTENQEANPEMQKVIEMIKDNRSTKQIIEDMPKYAFRSKEIDILRQTVMSDEYKTKSRDVYVAYYFGKTGSGKSTKVFTENEPLDVCRITNYPYTGVRFDAYTFQPVLVFEEFRSQIHISDMLSYLDRWPLLLPARYYDRTACFTKVYILSNLSLSEQYREIQKENPETFLALLRRINEVIEFEYGGIQIKHDVNEYRPKQNWTSQVVDWDKMRGA